MPETPELAEGVPDKVIQVVAKDYRPSVVVAIVVIALGIWGSGYVSSQAKATEETIDARIDAKVTPILKEFREDISFLKGRDEARETREREADRVAAQQGGDIRVIRQMLEDKWGSDHPRKK